MKMMTSKCVAAALKQLASMLELKMKLHLFWKLRVAQTSPVDLD